MLTPPVGAADEIVTVPVDDVPPVTVGGLTVRAVTGGGFTVNVPDFEMPFSEAVIVTSVGTETGWVVTLNDFEVVNGPKVSELGTEAIV